MDSLQVKQLIEQHLINSQVFATDLNGKFQVTVISEQFQDKSRVEKQQLVYSALKSYIDDGRIHALTIKSFTPAEWQDQLGKTNG